MDDKNRGLNMIAGRFPMLGLRETCPLVSGNILMNIHIGDDCLIKTTVDMLGVAVVQV